MSKVPYFGKKKDTKAITYIKTMEINIFRVEPSIPLNLCQILPKFGPDTPSKISLQIFIFARFSKKHKSVNFQKIEKSRFLDNDFET